MPAHRFPHQSLQELIAEIFAAAACERHEASVVADHLIQANLTGHDSHGVIRTPIYVRWLNEGKVRANQRLTVIFENDAVAVVDGHMGLGQSISEQAMTLGIQKTKKSGAAIIAIRNCGRRGKRCQEP
ncbi:MAG TPA: Ldh family oxidoreductase [Pirellulaceae bacterium]|nr:Ldh family oxidoreductase [Pirellulaceae bacterium]